MITDNQKNILLNLFITDNEDDKLHRVLESIIEKLNIKIDTKNISLEEKIHIVNSFKKDVKKINQPYKEQAKKLLNENKEIKPSIKKAEDKKIHKDPINRIVDLRNSQNRIECSEDYFLIQDILSYFVEKPQKYFVKIIKEGFSVQYLGKEKRTIVFSLRNLKLKNNKLTGQFYANRFYNKQEFLEYIAPPGLFSYQDLYQYNSLLCVQVKKIDKFKLNELLFSKDSKFLTESLIRIKKSDINAGRGRRNIEKRLLND